MPFRTTALALSAAALLAAGAVAQTTDAPATDTGPAPAQEAAPATAVPEEPKVTVETFGDWQVRCEAESGNCFMYQVAKDQQGNPVSEMNIVLLPDGADAAAGATVVTPLGSLLTEGVVVQIDDNEARQYAYGWCTRSGCFARFGLTDADIALMKRGSVARLRIVSVSAVDQPVVLGLSLTGFTAAFNRVSDK